MTDITRLRHFQKVFKGPNFAKAYHDMGDEIGAAADEIEKLRAALKEADERISRNNSLIGKMAIAIRRLKGAKTG